MTFKEYVALLAKELGGEIETEGDACAFSLGSAEGDRVEILMQGSDARGALLTCADLGEPPPAAVPIPVGGHSCNLLRGSV